MWWKIAYVSNTEKLRKKFSIKAFVLYTRQPGESLEEIVNIGTLLWHLGEGNIWRKIENKGQRFGYWDGRAGKK